MTALLARWMGICFVLGLAMIGQARSESVEERGKYLVWAGGCIGCHTDARNKGPELAGGRPLKTPFGTFYTPNITPDRDTGIGGWTAAEFVAALKRGESPDGDDYFPSFPYPSYAGMTDADAEAIYAYLMSLPPVSRTVGDHDLSFPFSYRFLVKGWKALFFDRIPAIADLSRGAVWNRGAYLVRALGHCGECHTPRNAMGALLPDMALAGTPEGPDGRPVPNITPDPATGIGRWSEADIVQLLRDGTKPDFDDVQGGMDEAVQNGLRHLRDDDLAAIAVYLRSVPPIVNRVRRAE